MINMIGLLTKTAGRRKVIFGIIVYVAFCVVYNIAQLIYTYRVDTQLPAILHADEIPILSNMTVKIIAIGSGITSKGLQSVNESNIAKKFQFISSLLPSFCHTVSSHFIYAFYLAHDYTDPVFSDDRLSAAFTEAFRHQISEVCPHSVRPKLHLINCTHSGKPAWAQNDAMMDAYHNNADYFYRVNDDTKMVTPQWAETFVAALDRYDPPRVGVVGPSHHGGNTDILTHDFVHRTHIDVFGFYYPRVFTDWFGDGWITRVYKPDRCTKMRQVRVKHTQRLGTRYDVNPSLKRLLLPVVHRDKLILERYVNRLVVTFY